MAAVALAPAPPSAPARPTRATPAARLATPLAIALGAVLLRVVGGVGFVNYDTLYALVWGRQLAHGSDPQYGIPFAPTPHPFLQILGIGLSPLPAGTIARVTVALAFLALAACGWAVYRLGALWFNRPTGAVAAVLLLTRVPILSYGVRAYVDVPYLLLVLGALVVETRRPRAGAPVLALLALAGLMRPEAWVFSGLYWLYLALPGRVPAAWADRLGWEPQGRGEAHGRAAVTAGEEPCGDRPPPRNWRPLPAGRLAGLALLALAAPLVWIGSDWLITGEPLWSLTNTRHTAQALGRETGIARVPEFVPRRIGEILGPAALAGGAIGGVLALLWLRRRALPGAIVGAAAVGVFAALSSAGLPINTRYAFLPAAILCVFCAAALCGWLLLDRSDPHRRTWMALGALVLVALLATAPSQYGTDHRELRTLARQQQIQDALVALVDDGSIAARCEPVGVPNHAPIPLLALWLQSPPAAIVSAQARTIARGTYVEPATAEVGRDYILDRSEHAHIVHVPAGFAQIRRTRTWVVYRHCA